MKKSDVSRPAASHGIGLSLIWFLPFAVAVTGLFFYACYHLITYQLYDELDRQITERVNLPVLLVFTAAAFFLLHLLRKKLSTGLPRRIYVLLPLIICSIISLYLILAVHGRAVNDALTMDGITNRFAVRDYTDFTLPGGYLYAKSHQVGYLAYEQLMYTVFGASNFFAYQVMNLVAILVTLYLLNRMTTLLFPGSDTFLTGCLLSCGMLFLFIYATHIYNDIISLPFQTAAMLLQLLYFRDKRLSYELLAGLCLSVGYLLKTNVIISAVAMAAMLLLHALHTLKSDGGVRSVLRALVLAAYLFLLPSLCMQGVRAYYTHLTGAASFPQGEPMSTYVALGLQENEEGQNGWYNGYNSRVFRENHYDHDETDLIARAEIRTRLHAFQENPAHAAYFFVKKFLTQWGDASCISLRNLELASRHVEGHSAPVNSLIYGRGRDACYLFMQVFHTLLLTGCIAFSVDAIRRKDLSDAQSLILLYIFGGMLFHSFWEASSRYTMRYYVFFVPFAAYGLMTIGNYFDRRKQR